MSLLLFTRDPPPAFAPNFQAMSRSARSDFAAIGKAVGPAPAPASQSAAFALNSDEWRLLAAFVNTALQKRDAPRALIPRLTALQELAGTWPALDGQLDGWGQVRGALGALGNDIIGYARHVVPRLYGQIAEILRALADRPDAALSARLRELLASATAEADERARRATQWSAAIGPFADAARRFVAAFHASERNPAIRIRLGEIPYLCLSVDGAGATIAGDERNGWDAMQFWVVEQTRPDGPYALRTADRSRSLFVDHVDGMEQRLPPMNMTIEEMINEGPRPHLVSTGETMDRAETLFWFTGERYLQPMQWPHHTLDCAGNDGWGQGTPVLNWRRNNGRNQKWKAQPRNFHDVEFWDACQAIAVQAAGIPAFQHLQGDWLAISSDLSEGISGVLGRIDAGLPFIAELDVETTIRAWDDIANEAELAIAGL